MYALVEDFGQEGTAILHDSQECPKYEGDTEQGIWGTIRFDYVSVVRYVTVEFRTMAKYLTFLSGVVDGRVSYDGREYLADSIGDPEQYGGAGSLDNPVYTCNLTLRRILEESEGGTGGGGTGGSGTGGGPPDVYFP
jgi:hypothetical protein